MTGVIGELRRLFRETEGFPPFRRNKYGEVEGWPANTLARVSEIIYSLVHSSTEDLCEALVEIDAANRSLVPEGLLVLLSRAAWDSPASPDLVQVARARQQGLSLCDALRQSCAQALKGSN